MAAPLGFLATGRWKNEIVAAVVTVHGEEEEMGSDFLIWNGRKKVSSDEQGMKVSLLLGIYYGDQAPNLKLLFPMLLKMKRCRRRSRSHRRSERKKTTAIAQMAKRLSVTTAISGVRLPSLSPCF
ncbi:hypothetical protein ACLOJK_036373 [Asimina triloba]